MIYIVIAVAAVLLFFMMKRSRKADYPPIASVGMPLVGTYIEFGKNPINFVKICYEKFGPIFTVPMLHKNLTFLMGPEVSAPFFQLTDDFMSQPEVYGFMTPVFGPGVVYDAEPKKRMQQMQNMTTGLRSERLKVYVPKIEKETLDYIARWGESGTINLLQALSELTIMSASRCLHGDEVREQMFEDVSRLFHDIDLGITPLSFFFPYLPTPAHNKRDEARKEMGALFAKVIKLRREEGYDSSKNTDILQVFMDLKYKDGTSLTEDEIAGLLIALLFAGQHTSSITSTWTMYFLMHNKRVFEEVMKEQHSVLNSQDEELNFDSVANMEYLQNCVKETLRMHPPLILLMRMAMADITTTSNGQKYTIPKGDIVVTSPAASGRIPTVFKTPDNYEPERFGAERNEQKTPFSYLGFGGGRHACMGQQFGLMQVKTIVSVLLRNYTFSPVDSEMPEPDYTAMVVGPMNHLMVNYKKISPN